MHENRRQTDCIDANTIRISNHARLRVMQRLGVVERAADHLRDLLAKAEQVESDLVKNATAWKVGSLLIVTDPDGEVVKTVFEKDGVDQ